MNLDNQTKLQILARRLDAKRRSPASNPVPATVIGQARRERAHQFTAGELATIAAIVRWSPGLSTPELRLAYNQDRVRRGLRSVGVSRFHDLVHGAGLVRHQPTPRARVYWFPTPSAVQPAEGVTA